VEVLRLTEERVLSNKDVTVVVKVETGLAPEADSVTMVVEVTVTVEAEGGVVVVVVEEEEEEEEVVAKTVAVDVCTQPTSKHP